MVDRRNLGGSSVALQSCWEWKRHVGYFEKIYYKVFARKPLFGVDIIYHVYMRWVILLHQCNIPEGEDIVYEFLNLLCLKIYFE